MITRIILVLVAAVALASCGGGDSSTSGDVGSSMPSYTINNFDVTGTSADNASGQAPINPAVNGGNFVMSWTLEDISDQHIFSAFVSLNDVLSSSDIKFYDEICSGAIPCGQSNPYSLDCFFNNSNEIFCAGNIGDTADLSSFLDTIPKDAFIIFESCDSSTLNCDTEAHAVQFQ